MNVPKLRFKEFNDELSNYKFKDICTFFSGGTPTSSNKDYYNGNIPFIRSGEIYSDNTELFINQDAINNSSAKLVNKGDLLLALYGATSGNVAISKIDGAINQAILCIKPQYGYSKIFIRYLLENKKETILKTFLQGGQGNLSAEIIKNLNYSFPQIEEQEKIGNMLSLLDKKIELQTRKIEDLKLFKLELKERLFKIFETKQTELEDIIIKWNKKNKDNKYSYVESISNKYGFIAQNEQFEDRNVASNDTKNYYVIEKGVFAYNPSRLNVGSLALKDNDKVSLVSPLYECFTTNQNNNFLYEWFNSKEFKKGTVSKFEGGVRNTLNFNNLCKIKISLPSLENQNKISNILNLYNNLIDLENQKLNKLIELKKGLMQNMFV